MPAMPLAMEVGVLLERLAVALDDPANRSTLYAELLNPDLHIWQSSLLTPEDADHMEHHWMQWMHNWTGDIEGITRETMRRTLEVAGELGHDEPLQGRFPAHHPIDLFVTCGAEQFQGFVSWRTTSTAGRHVVALFSAPDYSPPPPDDYEYWTGITPTEERPSSRTAGPTCSWHRECWSSATSPAPASNYHPSPQSSSSRLGR